MNAQHGEATKGPRSIDWPEEMDRLREENKELREALELIADEDNYRPDAPVLAARTFQGIARAGLSKSKAARGQT